MALFVLAAVGHRLAPFDAYPRIVGPVDAGVLLTCVLAAFFILLPFADRRGC